MIFIDPSELRETSNLKRYISDVVYKELPGLEANTGADLMVSPDGLPFPRNDRLLQVHIDNSAKLIQLKFGHDLPQSIIDGRLNEALARMQATDAMICQCWLEFVGLLGYDSTKGMATINGQLTYGNVPMKWIQINSAINAWLDRGGVYHHLPSGKLIPLHLAGIQKRVNEYYAGNTVKQVAPLPEKTVEIIEPTNPDLRKWKIAQRIVVVEDLRRMFQVIPGVKIGKTKADSIWRYMEDNNIRQDWSGFTDMLIGPKPELLNIKGIGKKLVSNIQRGLYLTREERERRNK